MITEAANAVTKQATVVADQIKANPKVVNQDALKTLEGLCKKLETACAN